MNVPLYQWNFSPALAWLYFICPESRFMNFSVKSKSQRRVNWCPEISRGEFCHRVKCALGFWDRFGVMTWFVKELRKRMPRAQGCQPKILFKYWFQLNEGVCDNMCNFYFFPSTKDVFSSLFQCLNVLEFTDPYINDNFIHWLLLKKTLEFLLLLS